MSLKGHPEGPVHSEQPVTSEEQSERLPGEEEVVEVKGVWKKSVVNVKRVLKEYGGVAVVLYTCISLSSLGFCYTVVNMGLNVEQVLTYLNLSFPGSNAASTFVLALVLHKPFFPVRAAITVTAAPVLVRWLRARGVLRAPGRQPVR